VLPFRASNILELSYLQNPVLSGGKCSVVVDWYTLLYDKERTAEIALNELVRTAQN
jgi:hypothetical protein